jgi:hypothetical protein
MYKELVKYMYAIEHGKEPPNADKKVESPVPIQWCPTTHAVFYLTGSPAELSQAAEIFDPEIILRYNRAAFRPRGWRGEWPARMDVAIRTFAHIQPVRWHLSQFKSS